MKRGIHAVWRNKIVAGRNGSSRHTVLDGRGQNQSILIYLQRERDRMVREAIGTYRGGREMRGHGLWDDGENDGMG